MQIAPRIDCASTRRCLTTLSAITTAMHAVRTNETIPVIPARVDPPQISPLTAVATATTTITALTGESARVSPDVQRAATNVALWMSTRMLDAQAPSGAVAANTNDTTISASTHP